MFKKMFGNTKKEEIQFLQKRIIISLVTMIAAIITMIFNTDIGLVVLAVVFLVWGWYFVKALFGYATIGAMFSRNIAVGVLLFIALFTVGYFVGIFLFIFGVCRFVYLKTEEIKERKSSEIGKR